MTQSEPTGDRRQILRAAGAVAIGAMIGCGSKRTAEVVDHAPVSQVISVHAPDGPAKALVQSHGIEWAASHGVKLQIVADRSAADVAVFPTADMGDLAPQLSPLPGNLTSGSDWNDILRVERTRLSMWNRQVLALPVLGSGLFLLIRKEAGPPPETWDEFRSFVVRLAKAYKQSILPPRPREFNSLERGFYMMAAPMVCKGVSEDELRHLKVDSIRTNEIFSFQWDLKTGQPRLNHPGFVQALEVLRDLEPHRFPDGGKAEAFGRGAQIAVVTLAELAAITKSLPKTQWLVAPLPAGENHNRIPWMGGGWYAGALNSAKDPGQATALIAALASPKTSLEAFLTPAIGGGPFRSSHFAAPVNVWYAFGLDQGQTPLLKEIIRQQADPSIVNPALPNRLPNRAAYRDALVEQIRNVLEKGADPTAALSSANQAWAQIAAKIPPAEHLRQLKLSLGLQ